MIRVIQIDNSGTTRSVLADWAAFDAYIDACLDNSGADVRNTGVLRLPLIDWHELERDIEVGRIDTDSVWTMESDQLVRADAVPGRGRVDVFGFAIPDNATIDDALDDSLDRAALFWSDSADFVFGCGDGSKMLNCDTSPDDDLKAVAKSEPTRR